MLLDLQLPDLDGLTVLQRLKALAPETSVIIVTMHDAPEFIRRAVELGAAGYVLKGITRRELVATVSAVREGESVLAPAALWRLLEEVTPASEGRPEGTDTGGAGRAGLAGGRPDEQGDRAAAPVERRFGEEMRPAPSQDAGGIGPGRRRRSKRFAEAGELAPDGGHMATRWWPSGPLTHRVRLGSVGSGKARSER